MGSCAICEFSVSNRRACLRVDTSRSSTTVDLMRSRRFRSSTRELAGPIDLALSWEHSEAGWFTAEECRRRTDFWGLHEGLDRTRSHVTEHPQMPREFQLWPGPGQSDPG